ncbi:MAG TPA: aminopeptidase N [Caulobacteraceae bacterium]|jgi:aminopeptidase N|nr:aminopeptidase N [Caulobacteraceae bacterium]
MRTETPAPIRLDEYRPPAFLVDEVSLDFTLEPKATRVRAKLSMRRNDGDPAQPLFLNGERLKPVSFAIDGRPLEEKEYILTDEGLTLVSPPNAFTLETEVEIDPEGNTALEGLYMSGGRFCTQCEAEGFRKITFFPDRPDVLARYTVRMEADKQACPRLLSNGNLVEHGDLDGGRHYAVWRDPFPKPCYLFALVAGVLDELADDFTTMSGRRIDLRIYVDPGQASRAAYAMDSLKRAMKWDEETYGREYDLDLFMIVAVRDFNFGAMENKGLNIFNSSLLLADAATATDVDYERIEGVVAHEYFHNWTGDRITCRDWFQLCVKEGLTVFRDQGFSADMRGHAVQRIKEVRNLRARQFPEDQGPLAHPVRPSSYLKIDNFYTATIYDKGAEVIRMLREIIGDEAFRRGMDRYFESFDGQAVTVEDFISCFGDALGDRRDDFFRWYGQAGTPEVKIECDYDSAARSVSLTLKQATAPTPGQAEKRALPIPIRIGVLDLDGRVQRFRPEGQPETDELLLTLEEGQRTIRLEGVERPPVLSALRGFSAPVKLAFKEASDDRFVRLAADPDLFNRWEAGQTLARDLILARATGKPDTAGEKRYAEALGRAIAGQSADAAFKALLLHPPIEQDLALEMAPADPAAIHAARDALRAAMADALAAELERIHDDYGVAETFSPDAESAGRRALRNAAIEVLAARGSDADRARARKHVEDARDMTAAMGGLTALMLLGGEDFDRALEAFYDQWKNEPLVIDKWFSIQGRAPDEGALGRVIGLTAHPAFDLKNPNRFRALVQNFAVNNPVRFHDPSGAGYRFLADQILVMDALNPNIAARLIEPLGGWRRYRPELAAKMRAELERIATHPGISKNVLELAAKSLET